MKKLFICFACAVAVLATGCLGQFDDTDLQARVNNLEDRVTALESLQKSVADLQTIIEAMEDGDYVKSATKTADGWEIDFAKAGKVTVTNGTNGADGTKVTAEKVDDVFYWFLDGKNTGLTVQGATPEFKLEDGYLYVTFDGKEWEPLGKSANDSLFANVDTSNPDYVVFTLANGEVIVVARHSDLSLVWADVEDMNGVAVVAGTTKEFAFTVEGDVETLQVEALCQGRVRAKVAMEGANGTLTVTVGDEVEDGYDRVVLLVSNGQRVIMSSLTFEAEGMKTVEHDARPVDVNGGNLDIVVSTNTEFTTVFDYAPGSAEGWIRLAEPTRAYTDRVVSFEIDPNPEEEWRSVEILFVSETDGQLLQTVEIVQNGTKVSLTAYAAILQYDGPYEEEWYNEDGQLVFGEEPVTEVELLWLPIKQAYEMYLYIDAKNIPNQEDIQVSGPETVPYVDAGWQFGQENVYALRIEFEEDFPLHDDEFTLTFTYEDAEPLTVKVTVAGYTPPFAVYPGVYKDGVWDMIWADNEVNYEEEIVSEVTLMYGENGFDSYIYVVSTNEAVAEVRSDAWLSVAQFQEYPGAPVSEHTWVISVDYDKAVEAGVEDGYVTSLAFVGESGAVLGRLAVNYVAPKLEVYAAQSSIKDGQFGWNPAVAGSKDDYSYGSKAVDGNVAPVFTDGTHEVTVVLG